MKILGNITQLCLHLIIDFLFGYIRSLFLTAVVLAYTATLLFAGSMIIISVSNNHPALLEQVLISFGLTTSFSFSINEEDIIRTFFYVSLGIYIVGRVIHLLSHKTLYMKDSTKLRLVVGSVALYCFLSLIFSPREYTNNVLSISVLLSFITLISAAVYFKVSPLLLKARRFFISILYQTRFY